jgi:hypothetical protein
MPEQETFPQNVRQGLLAVNREVDDVVEQSGHDGLL